MAEIKTILTAPQVRGFAVCDGGGYQELQETDPEYGNWSFSDEGLQKLALAIEAAVLSALTPPTWRCCEKMVEQGAGNMVCCGEPIEAAVLSANAGKVDAVVDKSPAQENNDGGGAFNPDWLGRRNGWNDALDSAIEVCAELNDQSEVGDSFDMAIEAIRALKSAPAAKGNAPDEVKS